MENVGSSPTLIKKQSVLNESVAQLEEGKRLKPVPVWVRISLDLQNNKHEPVAQLEEGKELKILKGVGSNPTRFTRPRIPT